MQSRPATCLLVLVLLTGLTGCTGARNLEIGRTFHAHLVASEYDAAWEMTNGDPRQWFGLRRGPGEPWAMTPGAVDDHWAAWDEEFRTRAVIVRWEATGRSAGLVYRETSDYELLLDRGWATHRTTYLIDEEGRIEGILVDSVGDPRPAGRGDEFLAWAEAHEPVELAALAPDGVVDPRGDHPPRFRALLERWRASAGLPPIAPDAP